MDSPFSWFTSTELEDKYTPGAIIITDRPTRRGWKIMSMESDRNEQNDGDTSSKASMRMSCVEVDGPAAQANVRVYIQVPMQNTEFKSPQQRRQQAKSKEPIELVAFRRMSDNPQVSKFTPALLGWYQGTQPFTGPVPGGLHTIIVWQMVPGIQLGTRVTIDPQPFWSLDGDQRQMIRKQFRKTFRELTRIGIMPAFASKRNLVWDNAEKKLFWVDFRDWDRVKPIPWSDVWFAIFGLVKPSDDSWAEEDWNGDTSQWLF